VVAAVYRELSRRRKQRLLLPLLHSAEPWVRSWAAAHGLEFAPEQAAPVLEVLSGKNGFVAFGARMTLKQWREGKLTFP